MCRIRYIFTSIRENIEVNGRILTIEVRISKVLATLKGIPATCFEEVYKNKSIKLQRHVVIIRTIKKYKIIRNAFFMLLQEYHEDASKTIIISVHFFLYKCKKWI